MNTQGSFLCFFFPSFLTRNKFWLVNEKKQITLPFRVKKGYQKKPAKEERVVFESENPKNISSLCSLSSLISPPSSVVSLSSSSTTTASSTTSTSPPVTAALWPFTEFLWWAQDISLFWQIFSLPFVLILVRNGCRKMQNRQPVFLHLAREGISQVEDINGNKSYQFWTHSLFVFLKSFRNWIEDQNILIFIKKKNWKRKGRSFKKAGVDAPFGLIWEEDLSFMSP